MRRFTRWILAVIGLGGDAQFSYQYLWPWFITKAMPVISLIAVVTVSVANSAPWWAYPFLVPIALAIAVVLFAAVLRLVPTAPLSKRGKHADSADVARRDIVTANRGSAAAAGGGAASTGQLGGITASGGVKMRDYYEAPSSTGDETQNIQRTIEELRSIQFPLGPDLRWFDSAEILLMAADRLTAPTPMMTFQAMIQTAIPEPDKPTDHKDVPPEVLSQYVLHEILSCQHDSYQLTSKGKAVVKKLRAERSLTLRTGRLAKLYNEGKNLLLYERDYAHPPPASTLGGLNYHDLVMTEFNKWDGPAQRFIAESYNPAEAALYGHRGWPLPQGETIFDIIRARLAHLEQLLAQASATSVA